VSGADLTLNTGRGAACRYASVLLGLSNTAGAVPGVLGVWAAGAIVDATGSWSLAIFYPAVAFQLLGCLVFSRFGSAERQPWG